MAEGKRARKTKGSGVGQAAAESVTAARTTLGRVVWAIAALCAALLAIGAILIALGANQDNGLVDLVLRMADALDLGVFSRKDGIFTFDGKNAETKAALVNWGIAALVYLIGGRILARIVEP